MYPTVVFVLVKTQRSMADICPSNASNVADLHLEDISLPAARAVHSTTDRKAESQDLWALSSQGGEGHGLEVILEVKASQVDTSG